MSRFVNLEFNDSFDDASQPEGVVKDEAYYLGQARTAFAAADFEKALRYHSKVLEFNPQNAAAWTGQVQALIEMGEFREAKLWADKAVERFPQEPELLAAKGVALARCGDLQGGLAFSDASIEERGDTPYVWLARGDVLLARLEARADYCFDKALMLAPQDWFVAWLGARIRHYYRQWILAMKLAEQARQRDPAQFVVWLQLGLCQRELGMIGAARASLEQARQLNPNSSEIQQALSKLAEAGFWSRLADAWRRLFGP